MVLDQWCDEWPFDRDHLTGQPDPEDSIVDGTLYIEPINPETRLAPIKQVR